MQSGVSLHDIVYNYKAWSDLCWSMLAQSGTEAAQPTRLRPLEQSSNGLVRSLSVATHIQTAVHCLVGDAKRRLTQLQKLLQHIMNNSSHCLHSLLPPKC